MSNLYHNYIHKDLSIRNLRELLEDMTSIFYGISFQELMSFKETIKYSDEDLYRFTNHEKYIDSLDKEQKLAIMKGVFGIENPTLEDFNKKFIDTENNLDRANIFQDAFDGKIDFNQLYGNDLGWYPTNGGLSLFISVYSINRENALVRSTNRVISEDLSEYVYFAGQRYFVKSFPVKLDVFPGTKISSPKISVYLWSKSFQTDMILDITDFIVSCSTNVSKDGGVFDLTLSPIIGKYDEEKGWIIDANSIHRYGQIGHAAYSSIYNLKGIKRESNFFFETILQSNDLIFVRFEVLNLEKKRLNEPKEYNRHPQELSGNLYDMIGLIDNVSKTSTSTNNDISIKVTGRDLMKLVTDDGSYYYPLQFVDGKVIVSDGDNSFIKRRIGDGNLLLNAVYSMRSISYNMELIFSLLANTSICSEDLFRTYSEFKFTGEEVDKDGFSFLKYDNNWRSGVDVSRNLKFRESNQSEKNEIQQNIDNLKVRIFRLIEQNSLDFQQNLTAQEIGDLVQQTLDWGKENISNYDKDLEDILEEKLLDVYKSLTNLSNGKFYYTWENLLSFDIDDLSEEERSFFVRTTNNFRTIAKTSVQIVRLENYKQNTFIPEEVNSKGIWSLVKLYVDRSIENLRVNDPSISYPDGSLVDYMRKLCQEPFVEFWGDTFGPFYNFIVRKPPFNQDSLREILAQRLYVEIKEDDIFQKNLSYNDSEIYTWYEIQPKGYYNNFGLESATPQLPIIQFKKMIEIWGCKRLKVTHQYLNYDKILYRNSDETANYMLSQGVEDLKYLIDSHVYLPFTRRGSIVLNGDRRIKRGSFIYLKSTSEIYHVDSVQQNASINDSQVDRTTIIEVSRGMVENFIIGTQVEGIERTVSYFNVVDTNIIREFLLAGLKLHEKDTGANIAERIQKDFGFNEDVFDFFIKRRDKNYNQ